MESGEILASQRAGGFADSRVGGESAAAELAAGDGDVATVGGEDADGGFVELCEGDLGDAAGEEGDAGAARAGGGEGAAELAEEKEIVDGWEQAFAIGKAKEF